LQIKRLLFTHYARSVQRTHKRRLAPETANYFGIAQLVIRGLTTPWYIHDGCAGLFEQEIEKQLAGSRRVLRMSPWTD